VDAFLEKKNKRKRIRKGKTERQEEEEEQGFGASKKTARSPEVEKKTGREMEKVLEKLEEMKVKIKEEIKEMVKENQQVKREIGRLREEFKNGEKKWEKGKNNMFERVARLEIKMENEERRRRKNNIVITGEGKSKQVIKEDIELRTIVKEKKREGKEVKVGYGKIK
jgi:predicted RNase H-like nuclease (RuvC/YqgF family)